MAEERMTIIDAQADFEGKLRGKDALVLGRFRGEIEISGRLSIGEGARVEATVVADSTEISGELKGDVRARNLVLAEKARVQGSVDARVLVVKEGAWLSGSVSAGAAETPAKPGSPTPAPSSPTPSSTPGGGATAGGGASKAGGA
jgi:cytoskeletal protein CcmA (bactofilin family)